MRLSRVKTPLNKRTKIAKNSIFAERLIKSKLTDILY